MRTFNLFVEILIEVERWPFLFICCFFSLQSLINVWNWYRLCVKNQRSKTKKFTSLFCGKKPEILLHFHYHANSSSQPNVERYPEGYLWTKHVHLSDELHGTIAYSTVTIRSCVSPVYKQINIGKRLDLTSHWLVNTTNYLRIFSNFFRAT